MALEGSIKDFGLADILQLIQLQKKTGILMMKNASIQTKVLFENGMVITAHHSESDGLDKIGEVLARAGRISEEQLKKAIQNQRQTKEKIGIILVNMGAVTKEELIKALDLQVKEILFGLFKWKEGQYSFNPTDISYERDYWHPVNTEFILMEAVRRVDEWPMIEKKISNLEIVFAKNEENADKVKGVKAEEDSLDDMFGESKQEEGVYLTQDEMSVYNLLDGQQNIHHLIEIGQLGAFETCKALSNLLSSGLIVQTSVSKAQTTQTLKAKTSEKQTKWSFVRMMGSGFVLAATVTLLTMTAGKFSHYVHIFENFGESYKNALLQQQHRQIADSIVTFYYRNNRMPEGLESLILAGYLDTGANRDPWGGEIKLEKQSDSLEYRLKSKPN